MFILAEMRDLVRVPPSKFHLPLEDAIISELNGKLSNKVVLNVGLCVCVFDIVRMEESFIYPGDGASHTRTQFRVVVFRPVMEEVLEGVIKESSINGLQVSLIFFDAIFIKPENMMTGAYYDETEKVWIWSYEDQHKLYMDVGEKITFRVISEKFVDTTPSGSDIAAGQQLDQHVLSESNLPSIGDSSKPENISNPLASKSPVSGVHPYSIYATIDCAGLGMNSWWEYSSQEGEEAVSDSTS